MDNIQPHQQRVIDELKELNEKRKKLLAFMETEQYKSLDQVEQNMMQGQSHAMGHYAYYLADRLSHWGIA